MRYILLLLTSILVTSCSDSDTTYITHKCNDCVYVTEFQYIPLGEEVHIQPVVHWKSCKNWPYKKQPVKIN